MNTELKTYRVHIEAGVLCYELIVTAINESQAANIAMGRFRALVSYERYEIATVWKIEEVEQ